MSNNISFEKLYTDSDYVAIARFNFSLERLMERYPDGAPTRVIAAALCIPEHEVEILYRQALSKMRHKLTEDFDWA